MLKCLKIWACIIQKLINQSFIRDNKKKPTKTIISTWKNMFYWAQKLLYEKKKHALVKQNSTIFKN